MQEKAAPHLYRPPGLQCKVQEKKVVAHTHLAKIPGPIIPDGVGAKGRFYFELCSGRADVSPPSLLPPACGMEHVIKGRSLRVGLDFAGIGCLSWALRMIGVPHEEVWCSDIDAACRKMLKHHSVGTRIFDDARAVPLDQFKSVDVYVATPPCQSFSLAGKRKGTADIRGALIWHVLRVAEKSQPTIILVENVASVCIRFEGAYSQLVHGLEGCGYCVVNKSNPVFNTLHHGVPQSRRRMILVAIHRRTGEGLDPSRTFAALPRAVCFH